MSVNFPYNANFQGTVSAPLFLSNQVLMAPVAAGTASTLTFGSISGTFSSITQSYAATLLTLNLTTDTLTTGSIGAVIGGIATLSAGNARITGSLAVDSVPTGTTAVINVTAANAGDFVAKSYSAADRYGMGQYANGKTRLFASGTFAPAQVCFSICGSNSSGAGTFTDILVARAPNNANPSVVITGNCTVTGSLTCGSLMVAGTSVNAQVNADFYATTGPAAIRNKPGSTVMHPSYILTAETQSGYVASASALSASSSPWNIFTSVGITTAANYSGGAYVGVSTTMISGTSYAGDWFQLQVPSMTQPTSYGLQSASAYSWRMGGSTDGFSWESIDSQVGTNPSGSMNVVNYNVTNTSYYTYFRFVLIRSWIGNSTLSISSMYFTGLTQLQVNSDWNAGSGTAQIVNRPALVNIGTNLNFSGGNFGVNQSSPSYTLDVSGSGRVTGSLSAGSVRLSGSLTVDATGPCINLSASNPGDMLVKSYTNPMDRYGLGQYAPTGVNAPATTRVFTSGSFGTLAAVALSLAGTGSGAAGTFTDVLTVRGTSGAAVLSASGNVGINTSFPAFTLDVAGTARILGGSTSSDNQLQLQPAIHGSPAAMVFNTYGANFGNNLTTRIMGTDDGNGGGILSFQTARTTRMTILNNGLIGINQTSPAFQLDVSGSARVTGELSVNNLSVQGSIIQGSAVYGVFNTTASSLAAGATNLNINSGNVRGNIVANGLAIVIPYTGLYSFTYSFNLANITEFLTISSNGTRPINYVVNGATSQYRWNFTSTAYCVAGDTIQAQVIISAAGNLTQQNNGAGFMNPFAVVVLLARTQ